MIPSKLACLSVGRKWIEALCKFIACHQLSLVVSSWNSLYLQLTVLVLASCPSFIGDKFQRPQLLLSSKIPLILLPGMPSFFVGQCLVDYGWTVTTSYILLSILLHCLNISVSSVVEHGSKVCMGWHQEHRVFFIHFSLIKRLQSVAIHVYM